MMSNDFEEETFNELDMCLIDSTRTLTRLMKGNPMVVRKMKQLYVRRAPAQLEFINAFSSLKELVHSKLKVTADEEVSFANKPSFPPGCSAKDLRALLVCRFCVCPYSEQNKRNYENCETFKR